MGEWTGTWKTTPHIKCACRCGKKDGAEMWKEIFDASHIDAMQHDGETKEHIKYFCEDCARKYGNS